MPELVRSLAFVKKAAAQANVTLGVLDAERAGFIGQGLDRASAVLHHRRDLERTHFDHGVILA